MRTLKTLLLVAAAASGAACGDDPAPNKVPTDVTPSAGTQTPAAGTPRAQVPVESALPDADPLTQDASSRVLADAVAAEASSEALREALLGIGESAGSVSVRRVAAKLLAKGDGTGGYDDPEGAAAVIEALVRAGDPQAPALAVALAKAAIEGDEVYGEFVTMLGAVEGNAEARALLVQMTDDSFFYGEALRELAALREKSAADQFADVATDAEEETYIRATAAAGLLAIGDPRAEGVLDSLVRGTDEDITSFDVIDGLAVPGLHEVLPWVRKLADPAIAEGDNCALEIAAAASAFATVRGPGGGVQEEMDWLRSLIGKDDGHSDEEVLTALWTLGDDAQAQAAANILAGTVTGVAVAADEGVGVDLFAAIAKRGAARQGRGRRRRSADPERPAPPRRRRPRLAHPHRRRPRLARVEVARARLPQDPAVRGPGRARASPSALRGRDLPERSEEAVTRHRRPCSPRRSASRRSSAGP